MARTEYALLSRFRTLMVLGFVCTAFLLTPPAWPQEHNMDNMPNMGSVSAPSPDPAEMAERLAWKRESEFNHHLAGLLVILAGMLVLAETGLANHWRWVRYVWPICFLAAGLFVLVFSDTEIWPFGPQTPWYAITHQPEDLQHKIFAVILLTLGYVELQRARGRLNSAWAGWFFPLTGIAGAILLLFHSHSGNMQAPHAMETMLHIQKEHRWFATAGVGVSITNGLAEAGAHKQQAFFKKVWPLFLIILGILLVLYNEN